MIHRGGLAMKLAAVFSIAFGAAAACVGCASHREDPVAVAAPASIDDASDVDEVALDAPPASPDDAAAVSAFHDALAPYGDWIWNDVYGWVWVPRAVPPGWRPYTDGHWELADDVGWTWVSDLDWGWAPFHYGRWLQDDDWGWCWVPGSTWAPSWVAWRSGDEFCGWAPLPPEAVFVRGRGIEHDRDDFERRIDSSAWVFVPRREFAERDLRDRIVIAPRNVTLVRETHDVTNLVDVDGRIVDRSIPVERIEQAIGRPVPRVRLRDEPSDVESRAAETRADTLSVRRPRVPPTRLDRRAADVLSGERPAPPNAAQRARAIVESRNLRDEAERRNLAAHAEAIRQALAERHRQEAANPPAGVPPADLQARQQAEMQAQQRMAERQQNALQRLQRLERARAAARPAPAARPPTAAAPPHPPKTR
jgi:uncharacterized protein DUF6600